MGMGMEVLTGFVTAPGATQVALTMGAGNSLTVRNTRPETKIWLLQAWADAQVAGTLRIRSARLHDNVDGMRLRTVISEVQPLLPRKFNQQLIQQDTLDVSLSGSAVAGDIETASLLLFYEDVLGVDARFIDHDRLMEAMGNIMAVENTVTAGAAGGYSGEESIRAEFDQFKANQDYALLGYHVGTECATVRWRGVDSGNLGVGGPGSDTDKHMTGSWFVDLSRQYQMPLIPVFNAANKFAVFLDVAQDENAAAVLVTSIYAELRPGALPVPVGRR